MMSLTDFPMSTDSAVTLLRIAFVSAVDQIMNNMENRKSDNRDYRKDHCCLLCFHFHDDPLTELIAALSQP